MGRNTRVWLTQTEPKQNPQKSEKFTIAHHTHHLSQMGRSIATRVEVLGIQFSKAGEIRKIQIHVMGELFKKTQTV